VGREAFIPPSGRKGRGDGKCENTLKKGKRPIDICFTYSSRGREVARSKKGKTCKYAGEKGTKRIPPPGRKKKGVIRRQRPPSSGKGTKTFFGGLKYREKAALGTNLIPAIQRGGKGRFAQYLHDEKGHPVENTISTSRKGGKKS